MHTNISDCPSAEEYSSSTCSAKIQGHVLHKDEETERKDSSHREVLSLTLSVENWQNIAFGKQAGRALQKEQDEARS